MNSVWPVAGPARVLAKFRLLVGAREAAAFMPFGPGRSALCRSWCRVWLRFWPLAGRTA